MKPILVIQHIPSDGPGNFGRWLAARGRRLELIETFRAIAIPRDISPYAGLCVLGGPMHAHDPLPHLDHTVALIRASVMNRIPVIGHCLGGQLLARAMGAQVIRHTEPELGWHLIERLNNPDARRWLGAEHAHTVLQWHYDTFGLPAGAIPIARSAICENQAYTLDGIHLGMQFHVEGDPQKVNDWCDECSDDLAEAAHFRGVQQSAPMRAGTAVHFPAMEKLAFQLYDEWSKALKS